MGTPPRRILALGRAGDSGQKPAVRGPTEGHSGPAGMAKGATYPGAEAKLIAQPRPGSCTPTLTTMPSPGCPRNLTDTQPHTQKAHIEACQPPSEVQCDHPGPH